MRLRVLREHVNKVPFIPFIMRMVDGSNLEVRHPETISIGKDAIFVSLVDDKIFRIVEPLLVQTIEYKSDSAMHLPSSFKPRRDDDFDPDNEV